MTKHYDTFTARHPLYRSCLPDWRFAYLAYQGGLDFKREHLFRHPAETAASFAERVRRVHYENYVAAVVEEKAALLFKRPPYRHADHPLWHQFNADIDRLGTSRDDFARRAFILSQIFGFLPVLVDLPPADDPDGRSAPYCVPILPFDLLNWADDDRGRLSWALIRETTRSAPGPDDPPAQRERFRIFDTTSWSLYQTAPDPAGGVVKIAQGDHNLGCVPLAFLYDKPHPTEHAVGLSSLLSIAERAKNILNNNSLIRDIADRCLFPFLAAQDYQGASEQRDRRVGTALMFWYPQGGSAPQWIEPDTSAIQTLRELNELETRRIYAEANLDLGFAEPLSPRSGIAHAYEWRRTNDDIAAKARSLEQFERSLDRLFAAWLNLRDFKSTISYPRDFSVLSFRSRLEEASNVLRLPLPPSALRLYLKRFIPELLDNLPADQAALLDADIDALTLPSTPIAPPPPTY
jgi:hypothetical protein